MEDLPTMFVTTPADDLHLNSFTISRKIISWPNSSDSCAEMIVVEWLGGTCHPFPNCLAENQGVGLCADSFHRQSISADIS